MANRGRAKKAAKLLCVLFLLIALAIFGINLYILHCGKGKIYYQTSEVSPTEVGLVMGTDLLRFNGSTNLHFFNRTEAAAMLYSAGKAKRLLISGNRNNKGFNEVDGMKKEILAKGVPKDVLILDYDGNSTWETLLHAKQLYHLKTIIIITDRFHASRAIFISRHFGINAVAFCHGNEALGVWWIRYHAREWLARVKVFFEVLADHRSGPNE